MQRTTEPDGGWNPLDDYRENQKAATPTPGGERGYGSDDQDTK